MIITAIQALGAYLRTNVKSEKGATAVEYGLLVALIAAIIVTIVATLGGQVGAGFETVSGALTGGGADTEE